MEFDRRGQERGGDATVQLQRPSHEHVRVFLHAGTEPFGQVLRENADVDRLQRFHAGKGDGEDGEVPLQTRVDGERTGRRIHCADVLAVVDLFQRQLLPIVPMFVVEMLTKKSVRLTRVVLIDLQRRETCRQTTKRKNALRACSCRR